MIYRNRWDVLAPSTLLFSQSTSGMISNIWENRGHKDCFALAKTMRILQETCIRTIYLISDGEIDHTDKSC